MNAKGEGEKTRIWKVKNPYKSEIYKGFTFLAEAVRDYVKTTFSIATEGDCAYEV